MERREGLSPEQFYSYVTTNVSREELNVWVKACNINTEKSELFFDFTNVLCKLIFDTYLGNDVITNDQDKQGHFDWCWNNVLENFKGENITFREEGRHYEYFWNFYSESFYNNPKDTDVVLKIKDFFGKLLILHLPKTKSELDIFGEIYIILNNNLIVNQ